MAMSTSFLLKTVITSHSFIHRYFLFFRFSNL
jgi:hypothetical protein